MIYKYLNKCLQKKIKAKNIYNMFHRRFEGLLRKNCFSERNDHKEYFQYQLIGGNN